MGIYRGEDSFLTVSEMDRKLRDAVQMSWLLQDKGIRINDKEIAIANMEKLLNRLLSRAIDNFKDDATIADEIGLQSPRK